MELMLALMDPEPLNYMVCPHPGVRSVYFLAEDGEEFTVRVLGIDTKDGVSCKIRGKVLNIRDHPDCLIYYDDEKRTGTLEKPEPSARHKVECDHCHHMVPNIATCTDCGRVMCP
jgi:hypothetical protein